MKATRARLIKQMTISAYAKVNLTLEVYPTRADGYHALRSLVLPISLSDTLNLSLAETISSDTGYPDDLIVRAVHALQAATGCAKGVSVQVEKRIPAGGGLGGGSADAAATLVALNRLWALDLEINALAEIGASVGSDVPALVWGQLGYATIMEGRGEKVTPLKRLAPLSLVLANAAIHTSTAEVYRHAPVRAWGSTTATEQMVAALETGNLVRVGELLMNDLESAAEVAQPEIAALRTNLASIPGVLATRMSGSGSTVFALAATPAEAARIAEDFRTKKILTWVVEGPPKI